MQGEQSNEEKQAMEAKIKQLNEDLERKISVHDILTLQLKRLQVCRMLYIIIMLFFFYLSFYLRFF